MNSEFETRWEKISEVQIPEIKHLGFQEAVLDREIWNKAPEVEPEYHAYLVRENTNEKIDLDREKMILGKGSDADYKLEGKQGHQPQAMQPFSTKTVRCTSKTWARRIILM